MKNNFAFVDAQNVNLAIQDQWRKLDWRKLLNHLRKKYSVKRCYLFIWYIPTNQDLYTSLQESGYILIFKPVLNIWPWKTKWNVDAELVLQAMVDYNEYNKAVIITWDWDFACLVKHLVKNNKLRNLIVPNENKYSKFLRKEAKWNIDSLTNKREKLEYKK